MDILAGVLAYVAGIGALFAGLAVSFLVFFATPHEPLQTETQSQNARAMLVRPSTPNKPALEASAKQNATQSASHFEKSAEKHTAAADSSVAAQTTASARDPRRKHAASAAQARRLIQEERARRWAYQQDSSF
ncbi:MAG: hypothetical protein ACM3PO_11105 [Betaproteobacteria bacterium]